MEHNARVERGKRLKAAAKAKGLTSERIGEQLGVEGGTVRGWWRAYSEPDIGRLRLYAEVCGVSLDYLVTGTDLRLRFAKLIDEGTDPWAAIEMLADELHVDLQRLLQRVREDRRPVIEGAGEDMRATLTEASGGRWDLLNEEQQGAVLRLLDAMVAA